MCPLDINGALKALIVETTDTDLRETAENIKNSLMSNSIQLQVAVNLLSEHLLKIENAKLYKTYLSNILLALVAAKIPLEPVFSTKNYEACSDTEKIRHLEYSMILAVLCDHPDILQYTLKYFERNNVPPFEIFIHNEDSYKVAPKKRRLACRHRITDREIVTCCYNLLAQLPNELSLKWDWNKFIQNFKVHDNIEVRWMVKECIVMLTNMTECQSKRLAEKLEVPFIINQCIEKYVGDLETPVRPVDEVIKDEHLNRNSVVNIDGIMLPIYNIDNIKPGRLFPAKSTIDNLRSLALAVASGKGVSLLGPVGCGKTSLVEHLAAITGRKGIAFKKVQLGDQTDSRMLLGSHQCTDIPGEFIWRPGVLTEAVQNGHWLLLEDIDIAALDVASTLSSLLERNTLCVPGYRDALPVTPGFQLFVTQRIQVTNYGFQKKMSNSSLLLHKHLPQINLEPLSRSELAEIIQKHFPSLASISTKMVEVFMMFSMGSHDTSLQSEGYVKKRNNVTVMRGSRLISTRDLIKWCSRAVQDFNVSSPDSALKVLQDALDIFTCSVASPTDRLELAKKVGTELGIVKTKSEFYCKHYKPNVSLNPKSLDVGRAKVPRVEKNLESIDLDNKQVVFSFTRQSACLLEKISCCVTSNEPVLLVGETGTGKTSSVQYLARQTGHKLIVINMNQQSDSADLLGGYKPVDVKYILRPIRNEFEALFCSYYNVQKNKKFLGHIETCYNTENWAAMLTLMKQSHKAALKRLTSEKKEDVVKAWHALGIKLDKLEIQVKSASRLAFSFIEGSLVKAMQEGHWVLLDEINLASAEILECLAGLLEDKTETIDLIEKGDKVPIKRHPDFTLFACMNPATDVGKKDLPAGLRNRFTEFFVDELTQKNDLMLLIGDYLYHMNLSANVLEAIFNFYSNIRKEAKISLVDGSGNAPHYSLRTLCRALTASAKAKCGTVARSLYESFCLSFLTQLDSSSHPKVEAMIAKAVLGRKAVKSVLNQIIPEPQVLGQNFLLFEGHWIPQGKLDINIPEGYILTPTVRKNLRDIARIISLSRLPVLLQGDTSVGKTSLITYIAKASGNYCVRINNHEHTDLQEYIGSYATDASGKLVFREGILVEAMRKGHWIILDELNLAPSDVLEALNRVLDDNRELFIPETQQVIKADPNFMLFATQNPPGLYGGRKMLSRAFRNRFVELHFDEIPRKELEIILHQRCHVPPAYCKKMIAVMAELQTRRRGSAAVQGKDGFITLRDLFRWGQRYKQASKDILTDDKFYDWDQHIADEGYLVLAGKVRQTEERAIIEEVIQKQIKRTVAPDNLFNLNDATSPVTKSILESILKNQLEEFSHVVWTYNMRRLAVLIAKAFVFDEPVLLVGETGCGKTTICQVLAALSQRQLLSVNCHMHTESSDFLGGLRPVRDYKNDGRLFEWADGPLVKAMINGDLFLADEISLADDSVLERLNSLLETERQLVLAERGMDDNTDIMIVTANKDFHFIGTMNPGGDFGKKELSPALRNRFTEIWCDSVSSRQDLLQVLEKSVCQGISLGNQEDGSSGIGNYILDFTNWLKGSDVTSKFPFSIRDLLSWVHFINSSVAKGLLDTPEAYVHGACMTFLDCFGTTLTGHIELDKISQLRKTAIDFLLDQIKIVGNEYVDSLRKTLSDKSANFKVEFDDTKFGIKPFYIDIGPKMDVKLLNDFIFTSPTTGSNTLRLLRGLQLNKAILLEGNPGVGKTSLVTALAKSSGHNVIRINLSDQTDITDLFGTDLPAEDGSFTFKEGVFLKALQNGDWILLDELNLAPQPVLEGLNACLDHRGEVFIPELGKTFKVEKQTRLFACQNPLKQGGARRGLPISFLNRFTQVYVDTLTKEDLIYIVKSLYPILPLEVLHKIVNFNCIIEHELTVNKTWGQKGGPWEMNLRDIQRWCEALIRDMNCDGVNYEYKHGGFENGQKCDDTIIDVVDVHINVVKIIDNGSESDEDVDDDSDKTYDGEKTAEESDDNECDKGSKNVSDNENETNDVSKNDSDSDNENETDEGTKNDNDGDSENESESKDTNKINDTNENVDSENQDDDNDHDGFYLDISPGKFVEMIYMNRMRSSVDRHKMCNIYEAIFGPGYPLGVLKPHFIISDDKLTIGDVSIKRKEFKWFLNRRVTPTGTMLLRHQMSVLKTLAQCVEMNWLSILVGPTAAGKSTVVQMLADLTVNDLQVIPVTSAMDVSDLLGSFEQVDYNRNLETFFDELESLTIGIVQKIFLEKDNWNAIKLLTALHQHKHMTTDSTNPDDEMSLLNKKIQFLFKHVENLLTYNKFEGDINQSKISQQLKCITEELKHFESKVANVSSVNGGGKFEWVDSVLVKAIVKGSWVLLDNVNLTSAAVLDRLNGLLEPNGVLSIPERGEHSEIIPHRDFRMFFTMDPKYGEISRAMRNRGVEIFFVRPEDWSENLLNAIPFLDLSALLSSRKIPMELHDLLIICHETLSATVNGLEKPDLGHLLQAAQLIWQQMIRAIPYKEAILNSFSDVYIKPRCGNDFNITENITIPLARGKYEMLFKLKQILDEPRVTSATSDSHTLSIEGLCKHSIFEYSKQLAYNVVYFNNQWDSNRNMTFHILFNLYTAYQRCPEEATSFLFEIIKRMYERKNDYGNTFREFGLQLNNVAYNCLQTISLSNDSSVDQNVSHKRFHPEVYPSLTDEEEFYSNAKYVLFFYNLNKCFYTHMYKTYDFTIIRYSEAVLSGKLTDDFIEYPLLKHCKDFISIVDEYVEKTIDAGQNSLTDSNTCKLLYSFTRMTRFYEICTSPIFVKDGKSKSVLNVENTMLLYLHCKWVLKYMMLPMFELLPSENPLRDEFNEKVKDMCSHTDIEISKMSRVSKKIRDLFREPKICKDEAEYKLCMKRVKAYNDVTLNLTEPLQNQLGKFYPTETSSCHAWDVPETTSSCTSLCDSDGFKVLKQEITDSEVKLRVIKHPVNVYVTHRILNLLNVLLYNTTIMLTKGRRSKIHSLEMKFVLNHLMKFSHDYYTLPPELINLTLFIQDFLTGTLKLESRFSTVFSKFWDQFYRLLTDSSAHYPLPFFNINSASTDVAENVPANSKRMSMNLPLLVYYAQKMTVSNSDEGSRHVLAYETVSLEDRESYSNQLEYMSNIIWKNIAIMEIASRNAVKNNIIFETRKYERLMIFTHLGTIPKKPQKGLMVNIDKLLPRTVELVHKYFEYNPPFANMLSETYKLYGKLKNIVKTDTGANVNETKILTAQFSLLTTLLLVRLMSEIKPVDHIEKYRLKYQYIGDDMDMFDLLLGAYYYQALVHGDIVEYQEITNKKITSDMLYAKFEDMVRIHPHCFRYFKLKKSIAGVMGKYAIGKAFRQKEPSYDSFAKSCRHFAKSVLSEKTINELAIGIITAANNLLADLKADTPCANHCAQASTVIKETSSWLYSVKAFAQKLESEYSENFADLAKPLQSALSQTVYSVTALKDLMKEMIAKIDHGGKFVGLITDLMKYPPDIPGKDGKTQHLNRFLSPVLMEAINKNVTDQESNVGELEKMHILKMNLLELSMHCNAFESVDSASFATVLTTLGALVETWQQQQLDIEKKKEDDEALYVTKSKCEDEDEEAVAREEIKEMFPSFTDDDFAEFKPPSLEQVPPKAHDTKNKPKHLISSDDVSLIYNWHSNFIRNLTRAEWLPPPKKLVDNDVVSASLQRYTTFSRIIENAWEALDVNLEADLAPGLIVLISQIKNKVDGKDDANSKTDFYRSPWVSQTSECVPLLQRIKKTTDSLLDQWPDFPTLKEIKVIADRILSFPLNSPVSRFLTGLELLRDKIEEWNKNAHKGNNLVEDSLEVGQQIVNWRKLEMGHWKECLNNLYQRKQAEAHKYWFYLYNVVKSYLDVNEGSDSIPASRVITVLREFMEKSNLVEYSVRLDIIYVYHCHLVHLEASEKRDELLSVLWNTYNYYAQFNAQVAARIKEKRAPIEKKLRDFVKICSWDRDLSYWSVKDTVDKAHKALHKHTKEFENVLKESVVSVCLVDNGVDIGVEHVGIWDRPKRVTNAASPAGGAYLIDTQNFVLQNRNVKKYIDQAEQPTNDITDGCLLSKAVGLVNKAKVLCKDTITNTGYPNLVQALDDFVTVVIETSTHLGSLEVDASQPKEKQTSQAKSFVQQKRKALADLFKYLTKMGLNYRTGLVILNAAEDDLCDFTIPPVDLNASMGYLKNRRCDTTLSLLWSGCERYFQKNIARHRFLAAALLTPHKDLGIQNIERCKGFAAHLMKLTNTQKKSISKYSRYLYDLRTVSTNLTNALDVEKTDINMSLKLETLNECYAQISLALDQFGILWRSLPDVSLDTDNEIRFDALITSSPIVRCYKNSEQWLEVKTVINTMITDVTKQKQSLLKLIHSNPKQMNKNKDFISAISNSHFEITKEATSNLKRFKDILSDLIDQYEFELDQPIEDTKTIHHPVFRSLADLHDYMVDCLEKMDELDETSDEVMDEDSLGTLIEKTEDILATMLLIIQSVYKKHLPKDNTEDSNNILNAIDEIIASEQSKDLLEDKHLKELLHDKLSGDTKLLQLESLVGKTQVLVTSYTQYMATAKSNIERGRQVVVRLVPVLEQTVLFVQYFVTQKVAVHRVTSKMLSVLLKIFSDLATKGFCKPSDLDMDEGEGDGGPGKLSSGTGLGEGQGQKDVSERIENQDQLDEANRPGEEKKDEDKDCKEEEKGINMSDDFDSHLQDVEKKDGDDSEQDDEDDADKQMGDTDNAAEKLDQQIWGSEDEDVDEQQESDKKDEKGQGESTGEKEMAAKEEEEGVDDGSDGKDKKKNREINPMDEPEVDDDHVDPYHGKQQQPMPEPEDFELPDNTELDGDDEDDDKDGETETENPFELDVPMDEKPKEQEETEKDDKDNGEKDGDEKKHGFEVSSDEEEDNDKTDENNQEEKDQETDQPEETENEDKPDDNEEPMDVDDEENLGDGPQDASEAEKKEENEKEDLPKNPEAMEDEEVEQKAQEANPQANPSNNDPTAEERAENAEMDRGTDDNVETSAKPLKDEDAPPFEQAQEQVGEDKQSMGRSDMDKSEKGHRGEKEKASEADSSQEKRNKRENKPGMTDHERTLGDVNAKKRKQAKTLNVEREEETGEGGEDQQEEEKEADAFQHVKQAKKDDLQAIDAATKEQADQQPTLQQDDEEAESLQEDEDVAMDANEEELEVQKAEEIKPEKVKDGPEKNKDKPTNKKDGGEEATGETGVEVEGEAAVTATVPRGLDTTYHTKLDNQPMQVDDISVDQYLAIREWLTTGSYENGPVGVWRTLWQNSAPAARALCEKLRLVLEPTGRSRRAGDFRTGRAINMRRVIPYIASHFRKDRIWLRRTKPAKREYKIAIAMDDSSSMSDNRSKELAFESLALVSQALNLLESGDLAVLSFGDKPKLLHPFTEQFSEHSGSKILEKLRFEQKKTKIAQLLDFCTVLFEEHTVRSDALNAKLLVIVSDGRGIFSEGETKVVQAVRRARQQGIFLVYVIIDNPVNKDSIMDIRRPLLDPDTNSLSGFVPYLDTFPFPFYLILRDMSALPTVLGDALRQWFELATNTS